MRACVPVCVCVCVTPTHKHLQVDLFSLGIVVFELWHPFATLHERDILLRALREAGAMPTQWEATHPAIARLIRYVG